MFVVLYGNVLCVRVVLEADKRNIFIIVLSTNI